MLYELFWCDCDIGVLSLSVLNCFILVHGWPCNLQDDFYLPLHYQHVLIWYQTGWCISNGLDLYFEAPGLNLVLDTGCHDYMIFPPRQIVLQLVNSHILPNPFQFIIVLFEIPTLKAGELITFLAHITLIPFSCKILQTKNNQPVAC